MNVDKNHTHTWRRVQLPRRTEIERTHGRERNQKRCTTSPERVGGLTVGGSKGKQDSGRREDMGEVGRRRWGLGDGGAKTMQIHR